MANDKTAIANIAFFSLGEKKITSLDDGSINAEKVSAVIEQIIDELLEDAWDFNSTRKQLTEVDDDDIPAFGKWDYVFSLPSDLSYIIGLCDENHDDIRYPYKREGEYLYTNQSEAFLLYHKNLHDDEGENDVSLMPLWFHRLISARIAYILSPNITDNQKVRTRIELEWRDAYLNAKEKHGEQHYMEDEGNTDWRDGANNILETL